MLIKNPRGWEVSENETTPESVFLNRRAFLAASGSALAGTALWPAGAQAQTPDGTLSLYPAERNPLYKGEREITPISVSSKYNNFYEFGSSKRIAKAAQKLPIRPWNVIIDGEINNPQTIGIEDLIKQMPLEERVYRHRCVERWAMTVPWTGFPMSALVKKADPKSSARYVAMQTFLNSKVARGQRQVWYPWPYLEGITIAEAMNDLTFLATGIYGKPLLKQFGAPLRLAVPWKYGFKSIKSITRVTFTSIKPESFWEKIQPKEYGFWANVNPKVPHPRWSQAHEELIGSGRRVETRLFNGYGEFVADLYKNLDGETLWR